MKISEITLPSKPGEKPKIKILRTLKFKCIRCGTFCCHLGSPEFTAEDFKLLQKKFGKDLEKYIEKREIKSRSEDYLLPFGFKSVNGSECTFLRCGKDTGKKRKSKCTIHSIRPLLCRTFPFVFEQNRNKITISVIPCPGIKFRKKSKKGKKGRKK